jgi:hypothetical protein
MFIPLLKLLIFTLSILMLTEKTSAEELPSVISCEPALDTKLLSAKNHIDDDRIININTISENGLTVPSLWWAKEQFDPFGGKMVDNWLAYTEEKRIDLVINFQLWSLLDYLDRYRFVDNFGNIAREYGYNLRVFGQQKNCLALYYFNVNSTPPKWEITFDGYLQNGLQINQSVGGVGE